MTTKEPQYAELFELRKKFGATSLGLAAEISWFEDPKRLGFVLARYKFVSRILMSNSKVAEVGCGDGFASRLVAQEVGHLTAVDFDPLFIANAIERLPKYEKRINFMEHDILRSPIPNSPFDGIFSCDVLEHIDPKYEDTFFRNIIGSLAPKGTVIIGTPSLASQKYASPRSIAGHVNCKSGKDLFNTCKSYFSNVMLFGMNDEVLHVGYPEMCHYYFVVCLNPLVTKN